MDREQQHKGHQARLAGRKAEKKKKKKDGHESNKPKNPKAFAVNSVRKTAKIVQRNFDLQTKRQHIPVVRRLQVEPPPVIVGVMGPRKVGKSLLIRNLVQHYTKKNVKEIHGPITVVAGKKNRLTFMECPNDLCATIDLVKVCDVMILMVDATSGLEIDQYELLTLMRVHGETKVVGVLNHLDVFKNPEKLRKAKKKIKDRYWKELYKGAKLFFLSGLKGEGKERNYGKTEIINLSKYILCQANKPRPVEWRNNHPYILVDRMEDITDREELRHSQKCNRRVCFYGFVHGTNMSGNQEICIPGAGHFTVDNTQYREDPCPLPDKKKNRSLTGKERLLYAPMSGVGDLIIDSDATYIDTGGSHSMTQRTEADEKLKASLQELLQPTKSVKMFANEGEGDNFSEGEEDEDELDDEDEEDEGDESDESDETDDEDGTDEEDEEDQDENEEGSSDEEDEKMSAHRKMFWVDDNNDSEDMLKGIDDEDEEDEDEEDAKVRTLKANIAFKERMKRKVNLMKTIYGEDAVVEANDDEEDEDKEKDEGGLEMKAMLDSITGRGEKERMKLALHLEEKKKDTTAVHLDSDDEDEFVVNFKSVFGRADASAEAETRLREDDELYGDFEDLEETGFDKSGPSKYSGDDDGDDDDEDEEDDDEDASDEDGEGDEDDGKEKSQEKKNGSVADECMGPHELSRKRKAAGREERRLAKKMRLKEKFDQLYDNKEDNSFYESWKAQTTAQAEMNMSEFQDMEDSQRVQVEGFRPGMYVRLEIADVPCELVTNFNPDFPIVIGGLQSTEGNIGYVQGTFQKHKWFPREVLKTRDPVIVSAGWWRFQTQAYYSKLEDNMRHRYLKYSARDYSFCHITFWGPIMAPKTGFVVMQTVQNVKPYRIAGTGSIITLDKSVNIEKKLRLKGNISEIFRKTAFIEGMFNNQLEVAKFQGALLRTQAGVRGIIKRAIKQGPPGSFRATFEDRVLKSDIVFCNCWYTVEVAKFYLPVYSLLLPRDEKSSWQGMRTTAEVRKERGLEVPVKKDSLYREVNRPVQRQPELRIPKPLMRELPFKDIPKNLGPMSETEKRIAVVRDAREKKIASVMSKLETLYKHKCKMDRMKMRERAQKHQKERAKIEDKKQAKQRERQKHAFRKLGMKKQKS